MHLQKNGIADSPFLPCDVLHRVSISEAKMNVVMKISPAVDQTATCIASRRRDLDCGFF
jgi:hypothetical protein